MSGSGSEAETIDLQANGFTFTGLAAGPESGELVLLLHGWPQFADSWTEVAFLLGKAGYRAVALDQRGYSVAARPEAEAAYAMEHLVADVLAFADALGRPRFHIVAHDWGAIVGWHVAQWHPERVLSFTSLAIPHPRALGEAKATDPDQQKRGAYVEFFKAPGNVAEKALLKNDATALRASYEGKLSSAQVDENVRRLSEPGALTAVLNWYRAFDFDSKLGDVSVPILHVWASNDRALGELSARNTSRYVSGPYRLEIVPTSHWIADEMPDEIVAMILPHLAACRASAKNS
jgi:pimeloyl-ACP methyl ester carboxylesterase